jgi:biopolymer transport protein ExbB/TolQ
MELDLVQIWTNMGSLVRAVVVFLTIQALACIAVTIDRLILLATSSRRSRRFAREAGSLLAKGDYERALSIAKKHEGSHLASFVATGLGTFMERVRDGHAREKAAQLANRALERKGENLSASLNRGMNVLASVGSTAPFVGLLGTVLGILHAFELIAQEGSGGLGTIGAAIGESLVVTGYGLMVAIPAVLVFNGLSGRIAKYESGLANAGSELVDQLEAGRPGHGPAEDAEDRAPEAAAVPSPA